MNTLSLIFIISSFCLHAGAQPSLAHINSANVQQIKSLDLSIADDTYLVIELKEVSSLVIQGETMSFYPVNDIRKVRLSAYKPGNYTLVILGPDRRKVSEIQLLLRK